MMIKMKNIQKIKIKQKKKLKVHKPIIDGRRLCNNVLKFKPSFHSI
jgi:hypothetical protein